MDVAGTNAPNNLVPFTLVQVSLHANELALLSKAVGQDYNL